MIARAGFVSRAGAYVLDAALVTAGLRTTVWLLEGAARALRWFAPPFQVRPLLAAIMPLLVAIYLVAFWTLGGRTPGKWLLGIRVVVVGGGPVGLRRALLRLVGYVVSAIPCYLGFFWIIGPQRRAWHDRLAGTDVVYVASLRRPVDRVRVTARPLRQLVT
jgi:uncharacterized RDD family membrane protein YckC